MTATSPGRPRSEGHVADGLGALLEAGRREGAFRAASAAVWHDGAPIIDAHIGLDEEDAAAALPPSRRRFDLASLTKPLATALVAMREVSAGRLDLDAPVAPDLPPHLTARALLSHRAGLVPWRPWASALPAGFAPGSPRTRFALDAFLRLEALASTPAVTPVYSDVGFLLLARRLVELTGRPLRACVPGFLGARPPRDLRPWVSTGWCPLRGRVLRGEVHDPQAWAFGGAAGHAGLFATAREVARLGAALVMRREGGPTDARLGQVAPSVISEFWSKEAVLTPGSWRLGWDSPTPGASSAGARFAEDAIGHLGFTGTSVWIEPSRRLVMVLLTDRVALGEGAQPLLRAFRARYHDDVRELLGVGEPVPQPVTG